MISFSGRVYVFLIVLISTNSNTNWDEGTTQSRGGLPRDHSGNTTYIITILGLNLKGLLSQGSRHFLINPVNASEDIYCAALRTPGSDVRIQL